MLYDIFAIGAIAGGIYSGTYFLKHARRNWKVDRQLSFMMFVYVLSSYWLAGVYLATLFDVIQVTSLTIGVYSRPATAVGLWIPALIMQRVEMLRLK
jgi:hypothetical protein